MGLDTAFPTIAPTPASSSAAASRILLWCCTLSTMLLLPNRSFTDSWNIFTRSTPRCSCVLANLDAPDLPGSSDSAAEIQRRLVTGGRGRPSTARPRCPPCTLLSAPLGVERGTDLVLQPLKQPGFQEVIVMVGVVYPHSTRNGGVTSLEQAVERCPPFSNGH